MKTKLCEICTIEYGNSWKKSDTPLKIPVYGTGGIIGYSTNAIAKGPAIIIGRKGTIDRPRYVDTPFWAIDTTFYVQAIADVNLKYIYYYMSTLQWYKYNEASGVPSLGRKTIQNIQINMPSKDMQNTITSILEKWDQAIAKLNELIEAKQTFRKALMNRLLTGMLRFPGFGKPVSKAGDLPEGWRRYCIQDIATEVSARNSKDADYPVILCSKHRGFVNSLEFFNKQVFSYDKSNYKLIKHWQFGFPTNHIEEGSIGLYEHEGVALLSPIYVVFEVDRNVVHPPYMYYVLKTSTYKHFFSINTTASVERRGNLRWAGFSKIQVDLPTLNEQNKITNCLNSISQEIAQLGHYKAQLIMQKSGLLNKFFDKEL